MMSTYDRTSDNWKKPTHLSDLTPTPQPDRNEFNVLVVFQNKNHVTKVFRPQGKHFTFGRSSSCTVKLSDPRFPRIAGDIILGPVPLIKEHRRGHKENEYTSIHPGKTYRIRPYKISLMEPGDFLINSGSRSYRGKLRLCLYTLLLASILATRLPINLSPQDKRLPTNYPTNAAAFIEPEQPNFIPFRKDPLENNAGGTGTDIPASPSTTTVVKLPFEPTGKKLPQFNLQASDGPVIEEPGEIKEGKREIYVLEDELDELILMTASLIEQGKLRTAGRVLQPLMPHFSRNQLEKVTRRLDPLIHDLFQKAYMLRIYEPEKSREVLDEIEGSGLDFLPSHKKTISSLANKHIGSTWFQGTVTGVDK